MAKEKGFTYINDKAGFDALKLGSAVKLPLLGLLADTDIPYEIDRRFEGDKYPSLQAMAETAMKALSAATKDSDKGFFLMIEGSRIDHAGHANDPAAQVHEVLAYDKAFASVLDFLAKDTVQGVMVSTSDHETGGLATARRMSRFIVVRLAVKPFTNIPRRTPRHLPRLSLVSRRPSKRLPLRRTSRLRILPAPTQRTRQR